MFEGCKQTQIVHCHCRFGPDRGLETITHDEKLTFLESSRRCWKDNGYLVIIRAEEDGEELYTELSKKYPEGSRFWAGGSDALTRGKWVNLANAEEFEYINWLPGRPKKAESDKKCMELVMKNGQLFANDVNCLEKRSYICEKEKMTK